MHLFMSTTQKTQETQGEEEIKQTIWYILCIITHVKYTYNTLKYDSYSKL